MKPDRYEMEILLRSEQSDGRVALLASWVPPAWDGPPLHHHGWDEAFYILAGELTFQVGDDIATKHAGEIAFAAGGVPHTFANLGDAPARYFLVCTPGGFERYFEGGDDSTSAAELPERFAVGPSLGESRRAHHNRAGS